MGASPARQAARARVAALEREGLRREELPSGHEFAAAVRRWWVVTARELHRCNGLARTLLEVVAYCAAHVAIVDCRALSVIGRRRGIGPRQVCAGLAELERRGYVVRVLRAGVRLPHQHGWETSAILPLGIVPFIDLMPPARLRKARADLARLALMDPRVRAALAAKGLALPGGAPPTSTAGPPALEPSPAPATRQDQTGARDPQASDAGTVTAAPVGAGNTITSTPIGTQSVTRSVPSVVLDRSQDPLPQPLPRGVERAGGAVAPSPHIAAPAAATGPGQRTAPAPTSAAGQRSSGPRPVPLSPATTGPEPRSALPPATRGPGATGSRSEVRPTLPEHLRGPHARFEDAVTWLVDHGVPRGRAIDHVRRYAKTARRRAWFDEHQGGQPGRQPRWRGAARELEALRKDAQRSVVEEGERGFSTWTKLRGELARTAGGPECFDYVAGICCSRETIGAAGEIVLHLAPTGDDRNAFERYRQWIEDTRAKLPIPVRIVWEVGW